MKTKTVDTPAGLTQSVSRALSILRCFSDETPQLRVTDISQMLDLTPSLVSRLLATLEHDGFVMRDSTTGMYGLGYAILTLSSVALNHNRLRMEALSEIQSASRDVGLGVNLAVLDHDAIFYLAHVEVPEAPRAYTLIGRRNPLHATAMGKILLAFLPDQARQALLDQLTLTPYTVCTCTGPGCSAEEMDQIRRQGWSLEMEELALGRACVAGPIRDQTGRIISALSFSGPLSQIRWESRRDELTHKIIELCDRISMRLGYVTAPGM
ncbi:MAG: IclR family transcriptional regulator [Chloroflexi bacterium]|nr:IclR family transcriptional regulator [Chloroflexota bacterium]